MRASRTPAFAMSVPMCLALLGGLTACQTMSQSAKPGLDDAGYDGIAESMDSLPDCIPELVGSSFWVREKKGAYDCAISGEWLNRRSAKVPDEAEEGEEEPGAWTPRLIEK